MTKCARCGKKLRRAYHHGGRIYGPECIKLYILTRYGQKVSVKPATETDNQLDIFEANHVQS